MKNFLIATGLAVGLMTSVIANDVATSAVGYWETVDDATGKVLSIVEFYPEADSTLSGKVYRILPILGQNPKDICTACTGDLHNQPIQGMRIIWGMTLEEPNSWVAGRALDPKNGNVYHARMTLIDNGCKLHLRGYIGIPLIGRTETWVRTMSKECPEAK